MEGDHPRVARDLPSPGHSLDEARDEACLADTVSPRCTRDGQKVDAGLLERDAASPRLKFRSNGLAPPLRAAGPVERRPGLLSEIAARLHPPLGLGAARLEP